MPKQAQPKLSDLPRLHADDVDGLSDQYSVTPALITDEGIALKNRVPRFQRLDAAGQLTQADDYVAVLETRFDLITGEPVKLIWDRNMLGCGRVTYDEAIKLVAAHTLCGKPARLPTIDELQALVDRTRFEPAIDPIFDCKPNFYWSSTPTAFSPSVYAWGVSFYDGDSDYFYQGSEAFVRAVRVSQ